MKALLLACCVLLMAACARPADPPGPALLFAGGQGDLSAKERLQVFNMLGLTVTPDGNTCTSGHAGSSALLLIRDASGVLQPNLGFPASASPSGVGTARLTITCAMTRKCRAVAIT